LGLGGDIRLFRIVDGANRIILLGRHERAYRDRLKKVFRTEPFGSIDIISFLTHIKCYRTDWFDVRLIFFTPL
ncbi:hypothetical protein, partial [Bradyrhizobium sp. BRP56]|uniref:hypothetical protein n=1 Tax=Bradyrhizobium sp. BRP56 TaxID=2793819 RepID=UPI001CD40E14